jgi:RNA polymerase sigma-70 factor (ECF subfamily)
MPNAQTVTLLLRELAEGDQAALDRLIPLVYDELRRIARGQLRRERLGHTLQPTALVNEVYARMVGQEQPDYRDRVHFLAVAARAMRRILIDYARGHNAGKRGDGQAVLQLDEAQKVSAERPMLVVALDDAMQALEQQDALKARLIEMRFFGGLSAEESATVLNLNVLEVRRELRLAQAWLQREMDRSPGDGTR